MQKLVQQNDRPEASSSSTSNASTPFPRQTPALGRVPLVSVKVLLRVLVIGLLGSLALAACGNKSADLDATEAVNVRIQNETGAKIDRLWLGAGPEVGSTFRTRYTGIDAGETTDYLTIEPNALNYSDMDLTIDDQRYPGHNIDPQVALGVDNLSAGSYYTFVVTLAGPDAVLADVTVDTP